MPRSGNKCAKNKSNVNFKTTIPSTNYDRQKQPEKVELKKYLGGILANDVKCTCAFKCSCVQQDERSFYWHTGLGIEAIELPHLEHSFMWC